MPDFDPVNSIKARCEATELKRGELVWAVLIAAGDAHMDIVPCRVIRNRDHRDEKGLWHIKYDLKYPVVKGLTIEWELLWSETDVLFRTKEDALIAAEVWMREKLREDADFIEKIAADDMSWDPDNDL